MIKSHLKTIAVAAVLATGLTGTTSAALASDAGIVYKQSASEEGSYCRI